MATRNVVMIFSGSEPMEPDGIRDEIERRKQRANDLKLRETLWTLYYWHLRRYRELLQKDIELTELDICIARLAAAEGWKELLQTVNDPLSVYPDIKETLEISDESVQFRMGPTAYQLFYKEGPSEERWHSGSRNSSEKVTPASLALATDGERVFDFEISRITRYEREGILFDETMGEITRFIEGPWIVELAELLQKIKLHEKAIRDQREAPELKEQMKRFGL